MLYPCLPLLSLMLRTLLSTSLKWMLTTLALVGTLTNSKFAIWSMTSTGTQRRDLSCFTRATKVTSTVFTRIRALWLRLLPKRLRVSSYSVSIVTSVFHIRSRPKLPLHLSTTSTSEWSRLWWISLSWLATCAKNTTWKIRLASSLVALMVACWRAGSEWSSLKLSRAH